MTSEFKVGDRVKALAYTDSSGVFHAEVTDLVVDSITRCGGVHGVAPYDRLNCLKSFVVVGYTSPIQVEAAARFFEKA